MIARTLRYAGPSAIARTLFGDLLGPTEYRLLLGAADVTGLFLALRTTPYAGLLRLPGKTLAFALRQHWISRAEKVANVMPAGTRELCLTYLAKMEVEALKTMLRGIARGIDRRRLVSMLGPLAATSAVPLDSLLAANSLDEAIKSLGGTSYAEAVAAGLQKAVAIHNKQSEFSLLPVETALERAFLHRLIGTLRRFSGRERKIVARLIGVLADVTNVTAVERLRTTFSLAPEAVSDYLVPFGLRLDAVQRRALCKWTGQGMPPFWFGSFTTPGGLRVAALRTLYREARKLLFVVPFQAGLSFAYVLLAELEAHDVIAIYEGKQWGVERTLIADRLVSFDARDAMGAFGV